MKSELVLLLFHQFNWINGETVVSNPIYIRWWEGDCTLLAATDGRRKFISESTIATQPNNITAVVEHFVKWKLMMVTCPCFGHIDIIIILSCIIWKGSLHFHSLLLYSMYFGLHCIVFPTKCSALYILVSILSWVGLGRSGKQRYK